MDNKGVDDEMRDLREGNQAKWTNTTKCVSCGSKETKYINSGKIKSQDLVKAYCKEPSCQGNH